MDTLTGASAGARAVMSGGPADIRVGRLPRSPLRVGNPVNVNMQTLRPELDDGAEGPSPVTVQRRARARARDAAVFAFMRSLLAASSERRARLSAQRRRRRREEEGAAADGLPSLDRGRAPGARGRSSGRAASRPLCASPRASRKSRASPPRPVLFAPPASARMTSALLTATAAPARPAAAARVGVSTRSRRAAAGAFALFGRAPPAPVAADAPAPATARPDFCESLPALAPGHWRIRLGAPPVDLIDTSREPASLLVGPWATAR